MEELKEEMDEREDAEYQQTQSILMALENISTRIGAGGVQVQGASKGARHRRRSSLDEVAVFGGSCLESAGMEG